MAVQLPTLQQIRELADEMGLDLTDADVESYIGLLQGNVDAYNVVDAMPDNLPLVKYPRTPGYQPGGEENQYNAWYVKTEFKGASQGKLKGKTVVLKDNVMLAGADGYDPRQSNVKTQRYTEALKGKDGLEGMKIAVVKEGYYMQENGAAHGPMGLSISQPLRRVPAEKDVDEKVKAAAAVPKSLGATVEEVSIPMHLVGSAIAAPILIQGGDGTYWGSAYGRSNSDLYENSLMDFCRNWRNRANELPENAKLVFMFSTYIRKYYGDRYYGKAINLSRLLRAAYDKVLDDYDLLAMPTTIKAQPMPAPDASREEYVKGCVPYHANTCPFNLTHHPAMAIPCGMSEGLPISLMLIGKHFDESTIYHAAHGFQEGTDWKEM